VTHEPHPLLSPRMQQALILISQGMPRKQVAISMGISVNTLKSCLRKAYDRLGAKNAPDAVTKLARIVDGEKFGAISVTQEVVLFRESGDYESKEISEPNTIVAAADRDIEPVENWNDTGANGS